MTKSYSKRIGGGKVHFGNALKHETETKGNKMRKTVNRPELVPKLLKRIEEHDEEKK